MSRHQIGNVATFNQSSLSDETSQMSQHIINVTTSHKTIGKVLQSNKIQCRDINLIDQTYRGNVATAMSDQHVNVATSDQGNLDSEISPMLQHRINVATSVATLVENFKITRYDVATSA